MTSLFWYCSTSVFSHAQTVLVCGKLPGSVVPVYSRKGEAHGRMLFQEKSDRLILKLEAITKNSLIESPDDNGVF